MELGAPSPRLASSQIIDLKGIKRALGWAFPCIEVPRKEHIPGGMSPSLSGQEKPRGRKRRCGSGEKKKCKNAPGKAQHAPASLGLRARSRCAKAFIPFLAMAGPTASAFGWSRIPSLTPSRPLPRVFAASSGKPEVTTLPKNGKNPRSSLLFRRSCWPPAKASTRKSMFFPPGTRITPRTQSRIHPRIKCITRRRVSGPTSLLVLRQDLRPASPQVPFLVPPRVPQ